MEELPPPILADILSRLDDSTDLARCRLVSRTLRCLSYDVRSVRLLCSSDRFLRSRAPETKNLIVPFKSVIRNLVSLLRGHLESLSIAIEEPFADNPYEDDEFDESDDLHLAAVDFVSLWLPEVGGRLRSLSISDFWIQSCWRRTEVLALISKGCDSLLRLEVKNAWLSVDGLRPMPLLTSLTLEFIRLDDEDLDKVNECFPSLLFLNLIGVGGLKEPKIVLPLLKTCHWTVSNVPLSLSIHAPNLIELKLECVNPKALFLGAPSLSCLNLKIEKDIGLVLMEICLNLKYLRMQWPSLPGILKVFMGCITVKKLEIESPMCAEPDNFLEPIALVNVLTAFPHLTDLKLGPGAWCELVKSFGLGGFRSGHKWQNMKKLTVYLPHREFDSAFISSVLDLCTPQCDVLMLIDENCPFDTATHLISMFRRNSPRVRWNWGTWKD